MLDGSTQATAQKSATNGAVNNGSEAPGDSVEDAPLPSPAPSVPPVVPTEPAEGVGGAIPPAPPPASIPSVQLPIVAPGAPPTIAPGAALDLQPGFTLAEEYSDNFNLTPTNRQSNFRTSMTPGLALAINGARTKGLVGYNLTIYYDTLGSEVGYFNNFLGQVQYRATPLLTLTAYDTLTQGDQPDQADRLGLRRERSRFTSNVLAVSADYLLGQVALRAGYVLSTFLDQTGDDNTLTQTIGVGASTTILQGALASVGYEYLRSDTSDLDIVGNLLTASLSRPLTPRTVGGVSANYAFRNVQDPTNQATSQDDSYSIWSIQLFGTYNLPPRLTVTGSIGYGRARSEAGENTPEIPASLTLTYRFARAVATLGAESGFSETCDLGENFGVVRTLGINGSLSYPITPLLGATATAFYRQNDPTGIGEVTRTPPDTNWGGALLLSAQIRSWLYLNLEYLYTNWSSPGGDDNYTENRVRAALSASF